MSEIVSPDQRLGPSSSQNIPPPDPRSQPSAPSPQPPVPSPREEDAGQMLSEKDIMMDAAYVKKPW